MATYEPERYIPIRIDLSVQHPELFTRLAGLQQLGLISDQELRQICRQYLTCLVPEQITVPEPSQEFSADEAQSTLFRPVPVASVAAHPDHSAQPAEPTAEPASPAMQPVAATSWVGQFLERLMNEVSVIWLLCLGVFLVVVSSAVLAASQWQNFSPIGQYGILFGYTIAFVIVGLWIGGQPRLQLTGGMLQIASLLIIPVNFWMMDGFRLLHTPNGIILAAIAAVLLSVATVRLLPRPKTSGLAMINALGLSWLHWGWGLPPIPLLATYVGCVGTSLVVLRQESLLGRAHESVTAAADELGSPPEEVELSPSWLRQLAPTHILLPFAILLLLFRALVVAQIPAEQLSLAFGICGWLLCWLARKHRARQVWGLMGAGLLLIGWGVGVGAAVPWQAALVSGLGLWLLGDRLQRLRQPADFVGLVLVGLATIVQLVELVPKPVGERITNTSLDWVGSAGMPAALWGVGLFPYLWAVMVLGVRLRRWQLPRLLRVADGMAWLLGASFVCMSLFNPILRSLALGLAFATLLVVQRQRQPANRALISITHGLGIATLFSTLGNFAPDLAAHHWGVVALGVMVLEWVALLLLTRQLLWQENTWFGGLGFAGLGYLLLLIPLYFAPWEWRASALSIPVCLTGLLFFPSFRWRSQALGFSIGSMIAVQLLTFDAVLPRLIGLGLGAVLMLLNTVQRPNLGTAILSVGFGLTFSYATGWETLPHGLQEWALLSGGLLGLLVGLRQVFREGWAISSSFKSALDGWSIAVLLWSTLPLVGYALLMVFGYSLAFPTTWLPKLIWMEPVAGLVILAAIVYRFWQKPAQGWLIAVAWAAEVALICTLAFWQQPLRWVAIATLALGLLSVLLAEAWARRTGQPYRWSWQLIPLGYGGLGWVLAHTEWTSISGLYTFALAAIFLGVGRRQPDWMPVTVLGLIQVSMGAFELLLYPLLRAQGGQPGDGLLVLAALAIALAVFAWVVDRWGTRLLNLPVESLHIFGHLHWGVSTWLLVPALLLPLSRLGERLWGAEMLVLGGYALVQGRRQPAWVYFGLGQIFAALGQGLSTHIAAGLLYPWASALTSAFGLGLYSLPWQRWGWLKTPFQRFAQGVPILITLLTAFSVNTSSLLLTGGFYGWMAFAAQTTRLSYIGLITANWAALRLLEQFNLTSRVWNVSLVGLSILFVAQVDPALRSSSQKGLRHWLRCFAVGLIGTTVLYESDPSFMAGLLAIGLSLALIMAGLLLRIRAFLYVGTLMFVAKILRLIWLFIADESLVLWALGIALGLVLIWIAATFEARRAQVTALLQYWVTELEQWQ
jgi:hypothetical protein